MIKSANVSKKWMDMSWKEQTTKEGFNVITIKNEVFSRAKDAYESKQQDLPTGTSFSKFVSDLILAQLELSEDKSNQEASLEQDILIHVDLAVKLNVS